VQGEGMRSEVIPLTAKRFSGDPGGLKPAQGGLSVVERETDRLVPCCWVGSVGGL